MIKMCKILQANKCKYIQKLKKKTWNYPRGKGQIKRNREKQKPWEQKEGKVQGFKYKRSVTARK